MGIKRLVDNDLTLNSNNEYYITQEDPLKKKKGQSWLEYLYSRIQFTWVTKWMYLGCIRTLPASILPQLSRSDNTRYWSRIFEDSLLIEQLKCVTSFDRKILVIRALWRSLYGQLLAMMALKALSEACEYLNNTVLRNFLEYKEKEDGLNLGDIPKEDKNIILESGLHYAIIMIFFNIVHVYISTQFNFWLSRVILRIQTCLKTSIFTRIIKNKACKQNNIEEIDSNKLIPNDEIVQLTELDDNRALAINNNEIKSSSLEEIEFTISKTSNSDNISNDRHVNSYAASTNVFNLLMVDVDDIEDLLMAITQFILLPYRLFIASLIMYQNIGSSAFPGIMVMVGIISLMVVVDIICALLKGPLLLWRDRRLEKLHESLNQIRGIQILGWEYFSEQRIQNERNNEVKYLFGIISLTSLSHMLFKLATSGAVVVVIIFHTWNFLSNSENNHSNLLGNDISQLRASTVIPLLHIINYVTHILETVPNSLNMLIEGWISLERFSFYLGLSNLKNNDLSQIHREISTRSRVISDTEFLEDKLQSEYLVSYLQKKVDNEISLFNDEKLEEKDILLPNSSNINSEGSPLLQIKNNSAIDTNYLNNVDIKNDDVENDKIQIYLENVSYYWEEITNSNKARPNLYVPKFVVEINTCHFIMGDPGSGKSTLLYGILGELNSTGLQFNASKGHTIGYSSQDPWIPIGTIRSVILFDRPWDQRRYQRVVEACLLVKDFSLWPENDLRMLDDGGHILSGGQRSRLTLARSLYGYLSEENLVDADIYNMKRRLDSKLFLLDDIFLSLDPNVGREIFWNLFNKKTGLLINYASLVVISPSVIDYFLHDEVISGNFDRFGIKFISWKILSNVLQPIELESLIDKYIPVATPHTITNEDNTYICTEKNTPNPSLEYIDVQIYTDIQRHIVNSNNSQENLSIDCDKPKPILTYDFYSEDIVYMSTEGQRTIPIQIYLWYINKTSKYMFALTICFAFVSLVLENSKDLFLAMWTGISPSGNKVIESNKVTNVRVSDIDHEHNMNTSEYLSNLYYLILIFLFSILCRFSAQIFQVIAGIIGAKNVHNEMLRCMLSTSLQFFDKATVGQIISRFCLDLMSVDRSIMLKICTFSIIVFEILIKGSFVVYVFPWIFLLIPVVGLFAWFWLFQYYRHTSRELFRSNLSAHTPICNIYTEALIGGVTIRAFKCEETYLNRNITYIDNLQRIKFMRSATSQWISVRMQMLALPFTVGITLFPIILKYFGISISFLNFGSSGTNAGTWGLALIYSMSYAPLINNAFSSFISVEKSMCAVERISIFLKDLHNTKQQTTINEVARDVLAYPSIPSLGLYIHKLNVLYEDNSLGIELQNQIVNYGECVGIIGRTGSGKSTLLNAILGLTPIKNSQVYLDGMWLYSNKLKLEKHDYIGVLPQDSIGFNGWTVRKFLDPYNEISSDSEIWQGLKICGLESIIRGLCCNNQLEATISGFSYKSRSNSSERSRLLKKRSSNNYFKSDCKLTQKYLRQLALARLIIHRHKYKIVLVDEPPEELSCDASLHQTSEFSPDTSVEEIIFTYMKHCIVFIVAHNSKSLKRCNRIWVLSCGHKVTECSFGDVGNQQLLAEFLRENQYGVFRS
ncbi:ABC transporter family protein [Cryptosporidium muris RN66]|uniref:ABC transporter family protein n=1 Tax=Cryptosporidium muris (strain RN66) TaxID=441375 RepID=B6A977_CRYMR|nr:ABC transporter family protein [Cryptosporidium muris RN66]EEA04768.1 ABC transporter family protein [Cryptosporidium muris RN66]|eukprot:XP_002139117.1 ABC transporter family protein [Cryptosporidium muris RN66]